MLFEDNVHLHVGYYENGYDLEGIFLKVYNKDIWCLFYNDETNDIRLPDKLAYPYINDFGNLIGIYNICDEVLTMEYGNDLFKDFLKLLNMI